MEEKLVSIYTRESDDALEKINPYLHSATPSFKLASRSPPSKRSPRDSSIKVRTSFAACGVYLSRRNLRISLSRDVTEAIVAVIVELSVLQRRREILLPLFIAWQAGGSCEGREG